MSAISANPRVPRLNSFVPRLRRRKGKATPPVPGTAEEVAIIRSSGLFDENWFRLHNVFEDLDADPITYYVESGARLGRAPHPLFDGDWYQQRQMELAVGSGFTPLAHYILHGADFGSSPHPLFDPEYYRTQRGEALPPGANLLHDFVTTGFRAGITPHPAFDATHYFEQVPGLDGSNINPLTHFVEIGATEGLWPNRWFNTSWYVSTYSSLLRPGENPLAHFLKYGPAERLNPHPLVDLASYQQTSGVPNDWMGAYIHLLQSGSRPSDHPSASIPMTATRSIIVDIIAPYFDVGWYGKQAKCGFATVKAAATHYFDAGWRFGLAPNFLFDPDFYSQMSGIEGNEVPLYDYVVRGSRAGIDPSPMLDLSYYRRQANLPDEGEEPLLHYLTKGAARRLKPNPLFDPTFIAARYGAVWGKSENALAQYLADPSKALAATHPLFLGSHYWSMSLQQFDATTPALSHFLRGGWRNETPPHPLFDPSFYLRRNADVRDGGRNPLLHFIDYGGLENRDPSPLFQVSFYERQRPRDMWVQQNPLIDYLTCDDAAWLAPTPDFDPEFFRHRYAHEFDARTTRPLVHYAQGARFRRMAASPDPGSAMKMLLAGACSVATCATAPSSAGRSILGVHRILHIARAYPGGTWAHVSALCQELRNEGHVAPILKYSGTGVVVMDGSEKIFEISSFSTEAIRCLLAFLRALKLDFVHFHQIFTADKSIRALPNLLDLKYYVTVHDYYHICPQVTCIDVTGRYCGIPDVARCDRCVQIIGPYDGLAEELREHGEQVGVWRESHGAWLRGASMVFGPSYDTARRIEQTINVRVATRPHPERIRRVVPAPPPSSQTIQVVLLGGIGPHKGSDLLFQCAADALLRQLPIVFTVVGAVNDPGRFARLKNVTISGPYPYGCGTDALRLGHYHCALFLSVWPETFAYTLSEVLAAGIFPISLDIGAIAERLRRMEWGHLIPLYSTPGDINDALMSLPSFRVPPPAGLATGHDITIIYGITMVLLIRLTRLNDPG